MEQHSPEAPRISVVIPVHDGADYLSRCLESLGRSSLAPFECIVVDDASTDGSTEIAEGHNCRVVRMSENVGPASARNHGAAAARGDIIFFIDADVCLHEDSLRRVSDHFAQDAELDALIGSYDDSPGAPDFLSQYKNLFHHFVHQNSREQASSFWGGCGAIRADVLRRYGGFDPGYERPAIEDIELGYRMKSDGRKLLLDKRLLVRHLKDWPFWKLVRTDIFDRGIPWTELILRDSTMPADLNLRISERLSVVAVYLWLALAGAAATYFEGPFLFPLLLIGLSMLGSYWFHDGVGPGGRKRRLPWIGAALAASAGLLYASGMTESAAPFGAALAAIFLQHWLLSGRPDSRTKRVGTLLTGAFTAAAVLHLLSFMPAHPLAVASNLLVITAVLLNARFYLFLARRRNVFFAFGAIPFHLLYHFYNGVSFVLGTALHWKKRVLKAERSRPAASPLK